MPGTARRLTSQRWRPAFLRVGLLTAAWGPAASFAAQSASPEDRIDAEREIVFVEKYFVNDRKPAPFASANVDLPRTVNDVQPYVFFEAREIELSGAATLEGFLRQNLTMDASTASESQNMFFGGNLSSVNLRGLGENHTLVLVNGRPAPAVNYGLAADRFPQPNINNIPVGAVDRIEVLPVGGSAIYGGNAIGGVINFVLKRHYKGGEVRMVYHNPGDTDAPMRRVEASYGFTLEGGRTRVLLFAAYSDQKLLQYQDRPYLRRYDELAFRNSPTRGNQLASATTNLRNTNLGQNLTLKNNGSTLSSPWTYVPAGAGPGTTTTALHAGLLANAGRQNPDLAGTSRQWKGGGQFDLGLGPRTRALTVGIRREMTPRLELNADFSFSGEKHIRNTALSNLVQRIPAAAPTNPFTTDVDAVMPVSGSWPNGSANLSRQFTTGFIYRFGDGWHAQGDYTWNFFQLGYYAVAPSYLATAALASALATGRINPFQDARFDFTEYQGRATYAGASGSSQIALRLAGPVGRLPAGSPTVGLLLERMQEGRRNATHDIVYPNYQGLTSQTVFLGRRQTTHSAAAEAKVPLVSAAQRRPLLRRLEMQVALRADDYAVRTGTPSVAVWPVPATRPAVFTNQARFQAVNPTAGLSYQPASWVHLRGSMAQSYTTPRFNQLVASPITTTVEVIDPRRGDTRATVPVTTGGNADLQPERARTWHGGIVIEPTSGLLRGLRATVDYIFFRKRDVIGTLSAQETVNLESFLPGRVGRAPPAAGTSFAVGELQSLDTTLQNFFKAYGDSFDATLRYRRQTDHFGRYEFSVRGTFGNHYKRKVVPFFPMIEYVNMNARGDQAATAWGPLKRQGTASLTWDYRRATVRWTTRAFGSYRVPGPPVVQLSAFVIPQGSEFVSSQTYHDLLLGYRFPVFAGSGFRSWRERAIHGLEVHLGVDNLFNQIPPYDYSTPFNFSQRGNVRLRDYRVMVKKPF